MGNQYVVYIDESGDASLRHVDKDYPIFVLVFCIFEVNSYVDKIVPRFQKLKFDHFGHDAVVLHENEIRRQEGDFIWLNDSALRASFLGDLSDAISTSDFRVLPVIIDKSKSGITDVFAKAVDVGLERLRAALASNFEDESEVWLIFESRGVAEDRALFQDFNLLHRHGRPLKFQIKFAPKAISSTGLQIADLVARPIGLDYLRPGQPNRSFELIRDKLIQDSDFTPESKPRQPTR